jgi:hypothetical protein
LGTGTPGATHTQVAYRWAYMYHYCHSSGTGTPGAPHTDAPRDRPGPARPGPARSAYRTCPVHPQAAAAPHAARGRVGVRSGTRAGGEGRGGEGWWGAEPLYIPRAAPLCTASTDTTYSAPLYVQRPCSCSAPVRALRRRCSHLLRAGLAGKDPSQGEGKAGDQPAVDERPRASPRPSMGEGKAGDRSR